MVKYEDMTKEERDRFIKTVLSEKEIEAAAAVYLKSKPESEAEDILKFCYKVAIKKFTPAHLKKKTAKPKNPTTEKK